MEQHKQDARQKWMQLMEQKDAGGVGKMFKKQKYDEYVAQVRQMSCCNVLIDVAMIWGVFAEFAQAGGCCLQSEGKNRPQSSWGNWAATQPSGVQPERPEKVSVAFLCICCTICNAATYTMS